MPRVGSQLRTLRFGSATFCAHIDGAAPRIEVLIAGIHSLGHRDRALLPQAPREFSEQIPRLLVAQAERAKPGRKPPARLAP